MAEAVGLPIVRDYDAHTFIVARGGRFVVGGFEQYAKPAFGKSIPDDWQQHLAPDEKHFSGFWVGKLEAMRGPLSRA